MKKLSTLALLAGIATSTVFLASCDKGTTSTSNSQPSAQYVKPFDSTSSFVNYYTGVEGFDFNSSLPLSLDFVHILNDLSNLANAIKDSNPNQRQQYLNHTLLAENAVFENIVREYAGLENKEILTQNQMFFDPNNASFTVLLNELSTQCSANNNYNADLAKVLAEVEAKFKDETPEALAQKKEEITNQINTWNTSFTQACDLTKELYNITQQPNFSYEALQAENQSATNTQEATSPEQPAAQEQSTETPAAEDKANQEQAPADGNTEKTTEEGKK